MPKKIKDLDELKRKALSGLECFIALNYNCKSSKFITRGGNKFYVNNYIDDSHNVFTEKELLKSNIGKALEKGSLYAE